MSDDQYQMEELRQHEYITHPSALQHFRGEVMPRAWSKLKPATRLKPSEWADKNRYIAYGSTKGQWHTDFVPYTKEPMDRVIDSSVEEVTVIAPNQSGKSEFGLCVVGYYMEHRPTDIAIYQPSLDLAKKFANDKVDTLIQSTPSLAEIVGELRSRDKKTKTLEKRYHGYHLFILGANSKSAFRQIWAEVVMKDDYDGWPPNIKGEGDPGKLADARTESFPHTKKIINISTTTKDGESRIQQKFLSSSMGFYHITCPTCGMKQVMLFSDRSIFHDMVPHGRLVYDEAHELQPEWAYYECGNPNCKNRVIEEWQKTNLVLHGEWIHQHPEQRKHLGYQWNRLVSPFSGWQAIAREFLSSIKDREALQVFVNLWLAEWFESQRHQSIDPTGLSDRIDHDIQSRVYEPVPASVRSAKINHKYAVPMAGVVVVVAVDHQDDRLEVVVKAWGLDEESFLIKRVVLRGSPARIEVWHKLDNLLDEEFYHVSGVTLRVRCTTIDIQGHFTDNVYAWINRKRNAGRNVFGVMGRGNTQTISRMIVDQISKNNKFKVPVIVVGVDTAKELVRSRLVDYDKTSAQLHFNDDLGEEGTLAVADYFKQLVAEDQIGILNRQSGTMRYQWRLRKGQKRNEAADLENYNLAGLRVMNLNMKLEHKRLLERIAELKEQPDQPAPRLEIKKPRRSNRDPFTSDYKP